MDFKTKYKLIQGNSATLKCKPIGEVTDCFWRKEFASRGAIHVDWFAYINDAPMYGESSNEYVADYYDQRISCSSGVPEEHKEYFNYQIQWHSTVGKLKHCRFSFPQPPMLYICILELFLAEE